MSDRKRGTGNRKRGTELGSRRVSVQRSASNAQHLAAEVLLLLAQLLLLKIISLERSREEREVGVGEFFNIKCGVHTFKNN